jgi:tRNA(Arg) A34 adenosine deaminase TadA
VIVDAGRIIGESWSRVIIDRDPTAHAELSAIRDACRRRQTGNLSGAILYSSFRPCPMCSAAAYWAGIGGVIHGDDLRDGGVPTLCRT